jgi:hypothetical protein
MKKELFYLKSEDKIYKRLIDEKIPEINERTTIFVKSYFEKYDEKCLPSWMLFEELTF